MTFRLVQQACSRYGYSVYTCKYYLKLELPTYLNTPNDQAFLDIVHLARYEHNDHGKSRRRDTNELVYVGNACAIKAFV